LRRLQGSFLGEGRGARVAAFRPKSAWAGASPKPKLPKLWDARDPGCGLAPLIAPGQCGGRVWVFFSVVFGSPFDSPFSRFCAIGSEWNLLSNGIWRRMYKTPSLQ